MIWIIILITVFIVCFGSVLLFGAPYLPTLRPQVKAAIELANLKPGETLLDLGCGDGKMLIAAAQLGVNSVGYELNPMLAIIAWLRTIRYRENVQVVWGDFWHSTWPPAEVIFVFLLEKYMQRLDTKIMQLKHKPVKLVSFAFQVPGKRAIREKQGVYLYLYD